MDEKKKNLLIVGTGPQAQIARDYFSEFTNYKVVGFACHREFKKIDEIYGLPLVTIENLPQDYPPDDIEVFVAIGYKKMNKIRQSVFMEIKNLGFRFANFIHPRATVCKTAEIGENVFIFEENTIQPYVRIGKNTVLWSGNHVGHHSVVGDHCFISSQVVISGNVKIENNVFIGVNATIIDNIVIKRYSLIGAGAIIKKDTFKNEVYISSDSKKINKNSKDIGL